MFNGFIMIIIYFTNITHFEITEDIYRNTFIYTFPPKYKDVGD